MSLERFCAHRHDGGFTLPGAEAHYPPDLELEPTHLDITVRVDIPQRSATASVVTMVRANRDRAERLTLQACRLEQVTVRDADGRPVTSRYDGREIRVRWHEPVARGEERRLQIDYVVREPVSGLLFSAPGGDRAKWAATDHETERARYWLPCVDHPTVRTTLAFHLTADAAMEILANGVLERDQQNPDGTRTAHWRLDYPCPSYLACFAVGELVRTEDRPIEGRPIAYFGVRGRSTAANLARTFGRTPEIMEWLTAKLDCPFPFGKYYQFAVPGIGGAMENISLVSWDDYCVLDEPLAREWGRGIDMVNVHEMAHSYFGDAIVMRDFAHAWLKESWATYMEICWCEDRLGGDEMRFELWRAGREYMREVDERYARPIVTRVYDASWSLFDAHLYPGGAWRLHMLRRELGDGPFWGAVRDYVRTYAGGLVETSDFQRKLEGHSGRSLERFFEQWLYRPGYPSLEVEMDHDDGKGRAVFKVKQTVAGGGDAAAPFSFPLTIAWQVADGTWARQTVEVEKASQSFELPIAAMPLQMRLDPDGALLFRLRFNPGDDMVRRALTSGPNPVARILAAFELARSGAVENLKAIGAAYAAEPFWGVRLGMAEAVADARGGQTVPLLVAFLAAEREPRVQRTLATRAGEYRDPRIAGALRALLDLEPTPRVKLAALRSLGMQRGDADLARLEQALDDPGHRHWARIGALAGLAETRSEAALAILADRLDRGAVSDDTVRHAIRAYGDAARHRDRSQRSAALERLADLARDPRHDVRLGVSLGCEGLGEPGGAEVVEGMLQSFAEQEHPRLRRIARDLRNGDREASIHAKLTQRLERIEEDHRKLEERLMKLEGPRAEATPGA